MWIDITRPFDENLITWPGRGRPQHRWEKQIINNDHCNVSSWQMSAHSGTHMDAPLHFVADGLPIDRISPDVFIGECRIVHLAPDATFNANLARKYCGTKRLLVGTSHSQPSLENNYPAHDPLMTDEAASILLAGGLVLIGTDRLSVDDSRGGSFGLHHRFLGSGCVILEGLVLSEVSEGDFYLFAAPLLLTNTEASPVRALLSTSD